MTWGLLFNMGENIRRYELCRGELRLMEIFKYKCRGVEDELLEKWLYIKSS